MDEIHDTQVPPPLEQNDEIIEARRVLIAEAIRTTGPGQQRIHESLDVENDGIKLGNWRIIVERVR